MTTYIFKGMVLPERELINLSLLTSTFKSKATDKVMFEIKLDITCNQITCWVDTNSECNLTIYDLKNEVQEYISIHLAVLGFVSGYVYNIEITQVIYEERSVGVFPIFIHCIQERNKNIDANNKFISLLSKVNSDKLSSIYLSRCFTDLTMAMKNPVDTGFYCYRAIESLREYCKNKHGMGKNKDAPWEKFREIIGYAERKDFDDYIKVVTDFAYPVRHGDTLHITDSNRVEIFMKTWDVVEAFLEKYQDFN